MNQATADKEFILKTVEMQRAEMRRMSSASLLCRFGSVGLASLVIALTGFQYHTVSEFVAFLPVVVLLVLDVYYLAREQKLRAIHDEFLQRVRTGTAQTEDLFSIAGPDVTVNDILSLLNSASILLFYLLVTLGVLIAAGK